MGGYFEVRIKCDTTDWVVGISLWEVIGYELPGCFFTYKSKLSRIACNISAITSNCVVREGITIFNLRSVELISNGASYCRLVTLERILSNSDVNGERAGLINSSAFQLHISCMLLDIFKHVILNQHCIEVIDFNSASIRVILNILEGVSFDVHLGRDRLIFSIA